MTDYKTQRLSIARQQRGLSLVELMVAIVVGSLLLLGVMEIFLGSKQTYRTIDNLSRMQENSRFSIDLLSHDIRIGGFAGCAGIASVSPNMIASNPPSGPGLTGGRAVAGYDGTSGAIDIDGDGSTGGANDITVRANTDVLVMSSAGSCSAQLASDMTSRTANISVTAAQDCKWKTNELLMITDCEAMDIFRASDVVSGSPISIVHAISDADSNIVNSDVRLTKAYEKNAVVFSYTDATYFIRDNNGEPTLYQTVNGQTDPLISGVENMQIRYGIDNNGDNSTDIYQTATAIGGPNSNNWASVISVEVNLLLRTMGQQGNTLTSEAQTYQYNGATVTATDNRIRRVVSKIITLRNQTL
ncbi:MAG: PilW family protein [Methylococcales bacterium]